MLNLVLKLCVLEFCTYAVQNFYFKNVAHGTDRQRYVKRTSPVLHKEKQSPWQKYVYTAAKNTYLVF